jgi:alkanesulfonate monooxygenase SsuD/methylene tetrahydromethanopterin reductase-like flavin-dependent oxidoreductase (luciferase family)
MKCGICIAAMNHTAWPAFDHWEETGEWQDPPISDYTVVREDIELAIAADELGFDSLWTVEHHGTPYNMCTNTVQWMTYFAGATKNLDLGTMVIVLPWHKNPVRVAEDIAMLQNVAGDDRNITIGIGRGASRREFRYMDIDMEESRGRFWEAQEIIKLALSQDVFEYDGEFFQVPSMSIRPQPRNGKEIADNLYCAWGSSGTLPVIAEADLKPLIIAQKPWEGYVDDLAELKKLRGERGLDPVKPIVAMTIYCSESEEEARRGGTQYFTEYANGAIRNYELHQGYFGKTKGYEGYPDQSTPLEKMTEEMSKIWVDHHVWGTPDQCEEQIRNICQMLDPDRIILLPRVGSMPIDKAQASLALFAKEVLPAIHDLEVTPQA